MLTVLYSQIMHHPDLGKFTAEASELGLTPGEWPDFIAVMHDAQPTEGVLFRRVAAPAAAAVSYRTNGGVLLTVFND